MWSSARRAWPTASARERVFILVLLILYPIVTGLAGLIAVFVALVMWFTATGAGADGYEAHYVSWIGFGVVSAYRAELWLHMQIWVALVHLFARGAA